MSKLDLKILAAPLIGARRSRHLQRLALLMRSDVSVSQGHPSRGSTEKH